MTSEQLNRTIFIKAPQYKQKGRNRSITVIDPCLILKVGATRVNTSTYFEEMDKMVWLEGNCFPDGIDNVKTPNSA